jgi:hypothetical protein
MLADSTPDRLPEGASTAVGLATKGAGLLL